MAFLVPDKTYTLHGLTISEKLITAKSGVKYYSNKKLNTPNNKPKYVTIHNTDDIAEASGTNDAEQYARATYNNAMGDVVVHYYIDETACWHILADDTVGYHAGDGANGTGNTQSIAIEVIMDGSGKSYDTKAEERAALLTAILLDKYSLKIDAVVQHNKWNGKNCPLYIRPHWSKFIEKVKKNLAEIQKPVQTEPTKPSNPTGSSKTIYRVQIGAFSDKKNAEAYVKQAEKAGFKGAFIVEEKR